MPAYAFGVQTAQLGWHMENCRRYLNNYIEKSCIFKRGCMQKEAFNYWTLFEKAIQYSKLFASTLELCLNSWLS